MASLVEALGSVRSSNRSIELKQLKDPKIQSLQRMNSVKAIPKLRHGLPPLNLTKSQTLTSISSS